MPPRVRRAALVVHVAASVGWMGAVAAFLALALTGLGAEDALRVRAAYLMMDVAATRVILPLALAALASGVLQALGTPWGLVRHWWVAMKLGITVLSTLALLLHMTVVGALAEAAALGDVTGLRALRVQLVANAVAALLGLLAATTLAVVKPRGLTPYGLRRRREALE